MVGREETYVLQVKGDSMIEEQIRDGDYVIVENRRFARDGEMVIALLDGETVTLKKLYREGGGRVRLQPANAALQPIYVDQDRLRIQGVVIGVLAQVLTDGAGSASERPARLPAEAFMAEDKPQQVDFNIVPDDTVEVPRTYSNFCAIQNSPFDFTLTFCDMQPPTERSCARRSRRTW